MSHCQMSYLIGILLIFTLFKVKKNMIYLTKDIIKKGTYLSCKRKSYFALKTQDVHDKIHRI